jgi:hypothetical protein
LQQHNIAAPHPEVAQDKFQLGNILEMMCGLYATFLADAVTLVCIVRADYIVLQ